MSSKKSSKFASKWNSLKVSVLAHCPCSKHQSCGRCAGRRGWLHMGCCKLCLSCPLKCLLVGTVFLPSLQKVTSKELEPYFLWVAPVISQHENPMSKVSRRRCIFRRGIKRGEKECATRVKGSVSGLWIGVGCKGNIRTLTAEGGRSKPSWETQENFTCLMFSISSSQRTSHVVPAQKSTLLPPAL